MLATLALLTTLSAADPSYAVLVVTTHGPSQTPAQIERAASVERASAGHAERLRAAAEITRARQEMSAAVLAQAKPSHPVVAPETTRPGTALARRN